MLFYERTGWLILVQIAQTGNNEPLGATDRYGSPHTKMLYRFLLGFRLTNIFKKCCGLSAIIDLLLLQSAGKISSIAKNSNLNTTVESPPKAYV